MLLFAVLWGVFFARLFVEGTLPGDLTGDTNVCFVAYREGLLRAFQTRNFPDLVSGYYLGQPVMRFGQHMLPYPTVVAGLVLQLPHTIYFQLDLLIHAVVSSLGMAWLTFRRGHHPLVCIVLGVAWTGSGVFMARVLGHWTILHQAALLPWLVAAWDRLDRVRGLRDGTRPLLLASAAGALVTINQTPHFLYALALSFLFLEVIRAFRRHRLLPISKRIPLLAGCVGVFALLAASPLLPMFAGMENSFRQLMRGPEMAQAFSATPINLVSVVSPFILFGESVHQFYGDSYPSESTLLTSRFIVLLAIAGLCTGIVRPRLFYGRLALPIVLVAVGFLLSVGAATEIVDELVDTLPLYGMLRAWGRTLAVAQLGLFLLAAEGARALLSPSKHYRIPVFFAAGCALLIASISLRLMTHLNAAPEDLFETARNLGYGIPHDESGLTPATVVSDFLREFILTGTLFGIAAVAFIVRAAPGPAHWRRFVLPVFFGVVILVDSIKIANMHIPWRHSLLTKDSYPELAAWIEKQRNDVTPEPLTILAAPRELATFPLFFDNVRSVSGVDSNMSLKYGRWLNRVQGEVDSASQLDSGIRRVTHELVVGTGTSAIISGRSGPKPDPNEEVLDGYSIRRWERPAYAVLVDPRTDRPAGTARVLSWQDGSVSVEVDTSAEVVLIVREFTNPGWRASLDDMPVPVGEFDHLVTVDVPTGKHTVKLVYVDRAGRLGLLLGSLSWIGWLLAFAGTVMVRYRNRRHLHVEQEEKRTPP